MTSIAEVIRHYQRSIARFAENEARLLHCLAKLNTLPINAKHLQATKVGRTVNILRKCDGEVGRAATALIAKWKTEVENSKSSREHELPTGIGTENIEPCTDSQQNSINVTSNSDSVSPSDNGKSKSSGSEEPQGKSISRSERKSSKNCENKRPTTSDCSSTLSRKSSNRREGDKTSDKPRTKHESDLIDIDCTMGTSFAEALRMLDMPSTSTKAKKLHAGKHSTCNVSPSSKHTKSSKSSSNDTPILLTKRPRLEPPLNIVDELLTSSSAINKFDTTTLECASFAQPPRKQTQTQQMNDEATIISCSIKSRTSKTKVFSGDKAGSKCKVPTLFEMSIRIVEDNIDLLEFTGGVPFDILRPVIERATYEQLMTLEDYNPYLIEDTSYLWEQHCKRRFRSKHRQEMETWREMYIRCLDEEQRKFNSLTATIKLSKDRLTKSIYVETNGHSNTKTKTNQMKSSVIAGASTLQNATKSKDPIPNRKRLKKSNEDPDWTPTTWYRTLYKKVREPKPPKPPKPPIKKTIDMLRYDRAKAIEKKKVEWKKPR